MKSWSGMSQDAKNKRRAKPSGKIHNKPAKKSKRVRIQHRYTGPDEGAHCMFTSDWFNREWGNAYGKYATMKAAEEAVKTMNRKDADRWEYRIKPNEENTKNTKGTA